MTDEEKIIELRSTIENLLEALDAPFADSCDCGGSQLCAICNAYLTLKNTEKGEPNE